MGCGSENSSGGVYAFDLAGTRVDPLKSSKAKAAVLLFVYSECPISNRYAPVVRRLHDKFSSKGVVFWLIYTDPKETVDGIKKHLEEYDYPCGALHDPHHELVKMTGVQVTPEAAVYDSSGELAYRGRIDDLYVDFGKKRAAASTHDLKDAIEATLAGEPLAVTRTKAIGCFIADMI